MLVSIPTSNQAAPELLENYFGWLEGANELIMYTLELALTCEHYYEEDYAAFTPALVCQLWRRLSNLIKNHLVYLPDPFGVSARFALRASSASGLCAPPDYCLTFFPNEEGSSQLVERFKHSMQDKGAAIGVRWAAGEMLNNLTNYVYPCHLMDVLDLPYAFIKNAYNGIMPSAYAGHHNQGWLSGDFINGFVRLYMPDLTELRHRAYDPLPLAGFMPDWHGSLVVFRAQRRKTDLEYLTLISKSHKCFRSGLEGIDVYLQTERVVHIVNHGNTHWSAVVLLKNRDSCRVLVLESAPHLQEDVNQEADEIIHWLVELTHWRHRVPHPAAHMLPLYEKEDFHVIKLPRGMLAIQKDAKSCGLFAILACMAVAGGLPFAQSQEWVARVRRRVCSKFLRNVAWQG